MRTNNVVFSSRRVQLNAIPRVLNAVRPSPDTTTSSPRAHNISYRINIALGARFGRGPSGLAAEGSWKLKKKKSMSRLPNKNFFSLSGSWRIFYIHIRGVSVHRDLKFIRGNKTSRSYRSSDSRNHFFLWEMENLF